MTKRHPNVEPAHPGDILRDDVIPALGISVTAVAKALDTSPWKLRQVLDKKQGVNAELAIKLELVIGCSAETWLAMQHDYDLWHARLRTKRQTVPAATGAAAKRR